MSRPGIRDVIVLFATAIAVQAICRYFPEVWLWHGQFYGLRFALRLAAPVAVAVALRWSPADLGLARPLLDRGSIAAAAFCVFLASAIVPLVRFAPAYQQQYWQWSSDAFSFAGRAKSFALFTASSLIGWEFLHRGFLLFGLKRALDRDGVPGKPVAPASAAVIAVCVTAAFEVLFHFTKPGLEAAGMMIASPLLSFLALRTRSLWIPLAIHLYIEALFFLFISGGLS